MTTGKKIKFWELVLMNVSAIYGIRWIARSTADSFGLGLAGIPSWVIFMFLCFVPQALMCAELAAAYTSDGSLGEWVKIAFGTKYGFLISWLNWTAKLFWFASFLTFMSINLSYMVGNPSLADSKIFVLILSLTVIWVLSIFSMKGMTFGKLFTNAGSLGSTIPTIFLIGMAFLAIVVLKKAPSASVYTIASMTPKPNGNSLVAISGIIFAYTGAEISATYVTEMENPKKNFPKAIITAAILICILYVCGSVAITSLLPTSEILASTGILDSLARACELLGIPYIFVQLVAAGITLSVIGALILYIGFPIKILFGNAQKGVFPEKFTENNEHGIPEKAIILQAVIISVLLAAVALLPGVDVIYNVLVTMTALTSLFPYVLLYLAYIKIKKQKKDDENLYQMTKSKSLCVAIGWFELIVCILSIAASAFPVMETFHDNVVYEVEMIGGGLLVLLSGLYIWKRSGLKNKVTPIE